MQPWENIKSHKVIGGMAWKHRPVTNKTRMFTFLHDIAKTLAKISKMHQQSCLTDKDHPEATNLSSTAIQLSATSVLIQHNQHGDCKQNDMASFEEPLYKAPTKSEQNPLWVYIFLISPEQYANKCMAVLIRRVTCKSLFSFWGQRKVLSSKFTFGDFEIVSFTAEGLSFSELRPSQQPF